MTRNGFVMRIRIEGTTAWRAAEPLNMNKSWISRYDFVTFHGIAFEYQSFRASRPGVDYAWGATVESRRLHELASRKQVIRTAGSPWDFSKTCYRSLCILSEKMTSCVPEWNVSLLKRVVKRTAKKFCLTCECAVRGFQYVTA